MKKWKVEKYKSGLSKSKKIYSQKESTWTVSEQKWNGPWKFLLWVSRHPKCTLTLCNIGYVNLTFICISLTWTSSLCTLLLELTHYQLRLTEIHLNLVTKWNNVLWIVLCYCTPFLTARIFFWIWYPLSKIDLNQHLKFDFHKILFARFKTLQILHLNTFNIFVKLVWQNPSINFELPWGVLDFFCRYW